MKPSAIYTKRTTTATEKQITGFPKYNLAKLLRQRHGELNIRFAIVKLSEYCNLKSFRTVQEWLKLEAGSPITINHLVLPKVLQYFGLQNESQLLTPEHKNLLKQQKTA